jgi:hypothetical protein
MTLIKYLRVQRNKTHICECMCVYLWVHHLCLYLWACHLHVSVCVNAYVSVTVSVCICMCICESLSMCVFVTASVCICVCWTLLCNRRYFRIIFHCVCHPVVRHFTQSPWLLLLESNVGNHDWVARVLITYRIGWHILIPFNSGKVTKPCVYDCAPKSNWTLR